MDTELRRIPIIQSDTELWLVLGGNANAAMENQKCDYAELPVDWSAAFNRVFAMFIFLVLRRFGADLTDYVSRREEGKWIVV